MKPVIGILMRIYDDKYYVKKELIDVIIKKDCIPINIYTISSIELCDGIIIPGGDKIDNNDLKIIKYLYDNNIPTLGICLGMQEMGYVFSGKFNDVSNYNHLRKNEKYVHKVYLNKKSKLYEIYGKDIIYVNSRHKDYLVSTDLSVSGICDVIESVEDNHKRFFIGVQWHPESMIEYDYDSNKLFDKFIEEIKKAD